MASRDRLRVAAGQMTAPDDKDHNRKIAGRLAPARHDDGSEDLLAPEVGDVSRPPDPLNGGADPPDAPSPRVSTRVGPPGIWSHAGNTTERVDLGTLHVAS